MTTVIRAFSYAILWTVYGISSPFLFRFPYSSTIRLVITTTLAHSISIQSAELSY